MQAGHCPPERSSLLDPVHLANGLVNVWLPNTVQLFGKQRQANKMIFSKITNIVIKFTKGHRRSRAPAECLYESHMARFIWTPLVRLVWPVFRTALNEPGQCGHLRLMNAHPIAREPKAKTNQIQSDYDFE